MPGTRVSYRYSSLNSETVKFLTNIVIFFNIIYAVLGACMIGTGLFMLLEQDFKRWIQDLGMQHYWTGVYILLAAGVVTMLMIFFGVIGAYQKKTSFLLTFAVFIILCIILEIVGASYLLKNGIRFSNIEDWLRNRFLELISLSDYDEKAKRTMSIVQEWVGCCGADGVADYTRWNKVIPKTCFDPVNGNAWYLKNYGYVGCVRGFTLYVENMTSWICGFALVLAFLQIFAAVAAVLLALQKTEFRKSTLNIN